MRLALIGDIHAYRLFVPPWRLVGKALVGQANLWLNRRRHFQRDLIHPLVQRVGEIGADMLLISGDLSTTAVRAEFADVAKALAPLLQNMPCMIVPGNHDRYTFSSLRKRRIEEVFPQQVPASFPHVSQLARRWHLLALDSSVPRAWTSRGRIGPRQLGDAAAFLQRVEPDQGVVVLCHYPFGTPPEVGPMRWHHALADAEQLKLALAGCPGKILFLHGHVHQPWHWKPENLPNVLDVNAGSPCLVGPAYSRGQGFWQIDLPDNLDQPVQLTHHVPAADGWETRLTVSSFLAGRH